MSEQLVAALLARSAGAAQAGEYELFKTTAHFDATARNAEWLGEEGARVEQLTPTTADWLSLPTIMLPPTCHGKLHPAQVGCDRSGRAPRQRPLAEMRSKFDRG